MKCCKIFFLMLGAFWVTGFAESTQRFNNQRILISYMENKITELSTVMKNTQNNPLQTPENNNNFIINIREKEIISNNISDILCQEFLQKYISPTDDNLETKLSSIHKMLNLCFLIKTSINPDNVQLLKQEMEEFKKIMRYNFKVDSRYSKKMPKKYSF